MAKMTPEQEARYALNLGVARWDLSRDAQDAYDRLTEQGTSAETPASVTRTGGPVTRYSMLDRIQAIGTLLVGLAAITALLFTWQSINVTNGQLQVAQQGQITDRYNAAITNLGSPSVDVRLGGIYALQRIMQDSPRDQSTVVAVLCAFVRDHATAVTVRSTSPLASPYTSPAASRPLTDIQAALTVVGIRNTAYDGSTTVVDFTNAYLLGAYLPGANFSGAHLNGVDLARAYMPGAHLFGADLFGADLSRANLSGAHLSGAHLSGAHLSGADLSGADLTHADLTGADLTHADLTGADLTHADLTGAKGLPTSLP